MPSLNKIVDAEGMFKLMENAGFCPDSVAYNILINGYGSCGKIEEGFSMLKANDTTVLHGLCKEKKIELALEIFGTLKDHGLHPDVKTFNTLLDGLCKAQYLDEAPELFHMANDYSVDLDILSFSTIIDGCCKRGKYKKSRDLFDEISVNI